MFEDAYKNFTGLFTKKRKGRKFKSVKYRCPTPYPGKKTKCTTRYLRQKEKEKT